VPNTRVALSPELPPELQKIVVEAQVIGTAAPRHVALILDGQLLEEFTRPPYRTTWPLSAGSHEVRAVGTDVTGQPVASSPTRFIVLASDTRRTW
jgi:hypothetical protein